MKKCRLIKTIGFNYQYKIEVQGIFGWRIIGRENFNEEAQAIAWFDNYIKHGTVDMIIREHP